MATTLRYLEDFGVTSCDATIQEIRTHEDGRTVIILDQTCFYPRGGGQDWDTGTITAGTQPFTVQEVRLDEHGNVWHIGQPAVTWPAGTAVTCQVDAGRRTLNTRLHSAGHVIDMAMAELRPGWVPAKGAHYPHMSFVEYEASDEDGADDGLQAKLQASVADLTQIPMPNRIMFVPVDQMGNYCRYVPTNIPTNKPGRIVIYGEDFGVPCGGTHVAQLTDVGQITITKIKVKKGIAKISYAIDGQ